MSRIVQGMSLINHFLGSVLASADIDSRRSTTNNNNNTNTTSNTNSPRQSVPSYIFPRGNTESIRTPAPSVETTTSSPTTDTANNVSAPKPKSTLSKSTSSSSSSSSSNNNDSKGTKRRLDQTELESEDLKKSLKTDKGKEKDKKD